MLGRTLSCVVCLAAVAAACGGGPNMPSRGAGPARDAGTPPAAAASPITTTSTVGLGRCLSGVMADGCFSAAAIRAHLPASATAVLPGAPAELTGDAAGRTVTLAWRAPVSGDPVTSYVIEAGSVSGLANLANLPTGNTATTLSATDTPDGTYYVRVRGRNAAGIGPASNEVVIAVAGANCTALPPAPTGLTATVRDQSVALRWTAPAGEVSLYLIEAGTIDGSSSLGTLNAGPSTSFLTSAPPGIYYARVRAKNSCGTGAPSSDASFVVSPPDVLWNVVLAPRPGLDISPCASNLYWATQTIRVDGNGAFHEIWSPDQPNTMRVDGTLTPRTFSGTLTCYSGTSPVGTMSATWDGSAFIGTVTFAGRSGPLRVVLGGGS